MFEIFTDGSCNPRDPVSASACVLFHASGIEILLSANGLGSVNRAELEGALLGLKRVMELAGIGHPDKRKNFQGKVPVAWYTDRQNIAYAVTPPQGEARHSRAVDGDLWASFGWFESWLDITAHFRPRNTVGAQRWADDLSGRIRRGFLELRPEDGWGGMLKTEPRRK